MYSRRFFTLVIAVLLLALPVAATAATPSSGSVHAIPSWQDAVAQFKAFLAAWVPGMGTAKHSSAVVAPVRGGGRCSGGICPQDVCLNGAMDPNGICITH